MLLLLVTYYSYQSLLGAKKAQDLDREADDDVEDTLGHASGRKSTNGVGIGQPSLSLSQPALEIQDGEGYFLYRQPEMNRANWETAPRLE